MSIISPPARLAALCLAVCVAACDSAGRSPVAPTLPPEPTLTPTGGVAAAPATLTGVVFEVVDSAAQPVAGVQVYCDACGEGHASIYTDDTGLYTFTNVIGGVYPLYLAKDGYRLRSPGAPASGGWMGSSEVRVAGDTRHDIEIVHQ